MTASTTFARVGELACQRNPFLRELCARIVSCDPVVGKKTTENGKGGNLSTNVQESYQVVLTDSVLFPEGGGQPCDYGILIYNNEKILIQKVQRIGDKCVITTPCPLKVGDEVHMSIDWPRRLDHMQHHTAQHLLSAIVENTEICGLTTISWSLTYPYCFIVLPTGKKIEPDIIEHIERLCNDAITKAIPVRCDVYPSKEAYYEYMLTKNTEKKEGDETIRKSRGIPVDVTGPIRIITLENDIDSCTCCGTHVTNLSQLQMIKLLHQETKGDTLKLFFITGDRLRRYYGDMYIREKELMKELGGVRPEDFVPTVIKKGKDYVTMERQLKNMTLELMKVESEKLITEAKRFIKENCNGIVIYRRDDVDADFFNALRDIFLQECPNSLAVFAWSTTLTTGAIKGVKPGQFMIIGPKERIEEVTPLVCSLLSGKGGMSKFGYRGKGDLSGWSDLVNKLQNN